MPSPATVLEPPCSGSFPVKDHRGRIAGRSSRFNARPAASSRSYYRPVGNGSALTASTGGRGKRPSKPGNVSAWAPASMRFSTGPATLWSARPGAPSLERGRSSRLSEGRLTGS